jgi:hypothetical protein
MIARTGQLGQNIRVRKAPDRTTGTRQLEDDSWDRTAGIDQHVEEIEDKMART